MALQFCQLGNFKADIMIKLITLLRNPYFSLSTMATARKVTPSNDPVECVDPNLLLGDMLVCL